MDIKVVTEQFSTLLQVAQAKVAAPNDVVVSSIPPRTDRTRTQQRVEELNSILQETSTTLGVNFISNDTSFRLGDGLSNDGYLSADGLHPNYRGTNRLATNLGVTPAGQEVQSTKTRTTRNHGDRRSTRQNERSQCRQTDNEWHTVRRYHDRRERGTTFWLYTVLLLLWRKWTCEAKLSPWPQVTMPHVSVVWTQIKVLTILGTRQ